MTGLVDLSTDGVLEKNHDDNSVLSKSIHAQCTTCITG